ncbi:MAG: hypothetical protein ACYCQI_13410 [Gammaproteobacteria bacterium]
MKDRKETNELGIEQLSINLGQISKETRRLTRAEVLGLIQQLWNDLPYATQVIPMHLSDSLLADTPQNKADLTLNEVILNLALSLYNPYQKEDVAILIKTYLHNRKATEREYADLVLNEVLHEKDLAIFPQQVRPGLKELAKFVIEKIIHEKQLRKTPNYDPQPLISIVVPIIYHRLYNVELERVRSTQQAAFRKWINNIAQDGYEKVIHPNKLLAILQEKENAFSEFKDAIAGMVPEQPEVNKFYYLLLFIQKDKAQKTAALKNQLDDFLKKVQPQLAQPLTIRFTDRLRKAFHHTDVNVEIYQTEDTIKQAHDKIFNAIQYEADVIKNLITIVSSIKSNYKKSILYMPVSSQSLAEIDTALMDILLGKNLLKPDPITTIPRYIREGGYPQKTLRELYGETIKSLQSSMENVSGMFAAKLKAEISRAIDALRTADKTLKQGLSIPEIKKPGQEQVSPAQASAPIPAKEVETPKTELPEVTKEPEPSITPEPTVVAESVKAEEKPEPQKITETSEPQKAAATPTPLGEETSVPEPKFEPKPLQIEFEEETPEPEKTLTPQPPVEETPTSEPKFEPKPLQIDFEEETPEPEKVVTPQPPVEETPTPEPKFEPKPLQIEFEENEPTAPPATESETYDQTTQAALDAGIVIMKNYQLGEFEKSIQLAWKKMVTAPATSTTEGQEGSLILPTDQNVRLYVMCDLAQQISAINAELLPDEQKQALENIKKQINQALANPLDENNWDYFEGMQRDIIDATLNALQ